MDAIFNNILILIPLAIIIVRFATQGKRRRKAAPKEAPPPVTMHFEAEEDDPEYYAKPLAFLGDDEVKPAKPAPKPKPKPKLIPVARPAAFDYSIREEGTSFQPVESSIRQAPIAAARAPAADVRKPETQGSAIFGLNNLSALKQAVVMAEVLGPPKALQ